MVTTESGKKITIVGDVDEETIEEIKKQVEKQADAASQDSTSGQDSSDSGKASGVQKKSKTSEVMKLTTKEKVKGKFRIIFSEIQTYVTNENPFFAWCVIAVSYTHLDPAGTFSESGEGRYSENRKNLSFTDGGPVFFLLCRTCTYDRSQRIDR